MIIAERPIIYHPEWQSTTQRLTSGTLTVIAWTVWMYLWTPFISAVLWVVGIHLVYTQLIQGLSMRSVCFIMLIVLLCSIIVASWASYNYMRFAQKTSRLRVQVVPPQIVGKAFGVSDAAILCLLLQERRIELCFDQDGVLVAAERLGAQSNEMRGAMNTVRKGAC